MDNGTFNDPKAPIYCNSWQNIRDTVWYAVKIVLNYLPGTPQSQASQPNQILSNREREELVQSLRFICTASNVEDLSVYNNSIQKMIQLESVVNTENQLACIFDKIEATQASLDDKTLKLDVYFRFKKKVDFHLECKEAENVEKVVENALMKYFSKSRPVTPDQFEVSLIRFLRLEKSSPKTKDITVKLDITSELDLENTKAESLQLQKNYGRD